MSEGLRWRWIILFVAAWVGLSAGLIAVASGGEDGAEPEVSAAETADATMEGMPAEADTHEGMPAEEAADHAHEDAGGHAAEEDAHGELAIPEGAQVLTVAGTEFEFDTPEITVEAGVPVALTYENVGAAEHDWVLFTPDGREVEGAHAHAMPGEEATAVFTLEPGEYEFWCTIPGHKELGMVGTLLAS